jgi:hypothetical protein
MLIHADNLKSEKLPQSVLKPGILRAHLSSDAEMESDYSYPSTF